MIGHIADGPEISAASDVDGAGGIIGDGHFSDFHGAVLAPSFVEGDPGGDAGSIVQMIDHALVFDEILLVRSIRPIGVLGIRRHAGPLRTVVRAWSVAIADLILPHHHAEAIAVVVVAAGFDLDVLADHVESGSFQILDVRKHRGIGRRSEQSIGPPSLIEWAPMENRFAIECVAPVTTAVLGFTEGTHGSVGFHRVE